MTVSALLLSHAALAQDAFVSPAPVAAPSIDRTGRPVPSTVGFGIGTSINSMSDLTQPNTAGVRFVLNDRWILEPTLRLSHTSNSVDTPGSTATVSTSSTTFSLGTMARAKLASRGPVDLAGLGGLNFGLTSEDVANDRSTTTLSLMWGLGLSWYFNPSWALSLDVTNPLFSLSRSSVESIGGDTVNTAWTAGAIWDHTNALLMLYFYM
ncbi:MAG: outer membrane beta-barrel protein [Deltaproteobacteria bacterium]|nr:outer membrane beta-barrel protein [Deltaproteobacteria bacterium]